MALKKRKDEDVRVISGFAGVFHKVVMFFTYPFRNPLLSLLIVGVVGAIIYFYPIVLHNVYPEEVYDWYTKKVDVVKSKVVIPYEPKGTDSLVETKNHPNSKEIRRQMFARASGQAAQRVDVLSREAANVVDIKDIRRAEEVVEAPRINQDVFQAEETKIVEDAAKEEEIVEEAFNYVEHKNEYSNLDYLDEVITIRGSAKVYNANELSIEDVYVFLYGIYVNPRSEKGVRGSVFLKKLLKGAEVKCDILAYTKEDKTATAECYVNDVDINKAMVQYGFSKKVELR